MAATATATATAAAALLGDDGQGYELARRLDGCGAWRAWLGESGYAALAHALKSPAAWDAFMSSRSQVHLHLQLRARALLFDKASSSLFLPSRPIASQSLSNVNPSYLQLHGDDVYFSLEDDSHDGGQHQVLQAQSRSGLSPCKANEHSYERMASFASRHNESESESALRHRHGELSETWYSQYSEKYKMIRHHKFPYGDKESHKRTPEGMSAYLKLSEIHKKRRQVFKEGNPVGNGDSKWENGSCVRPVSDMSNSSEEGNLFFPEIMFPTNCVPNRALPPVERLEEQRKIEVYGVLDNLPDVISRSTAMMERFGIIPEQLKMGSKYRGKDGAGGNKKPLSQEQASQMSQKVAARLLASVGFEGGSEVSMGVLADFIGNHICKLGCKLKLLSDSYRKQFSSMELLKMFIQTAGCSNLGTLMEITKDGNRGFTHQTQQQVRPVQTQQQNPLLQAQQFQRPMHPQLHLLHPQNLTFQQQQQLQQWEKQRRQRQANAPRGSMMMMEKEQTMVDVKLENVMELPLDGSFSNLNKQQMQIRQQQMAMSNTQTGQQFKQLSSPQISQLQGPISQLQAQSPYSSMRTPPVKVEAFHELLGGDSTSKHESEQNRLTPTQK